MTWITRRTPIKRTKPVNKVGKSDHSKKVVVANGLWRQLIRAKEPSGICPRCHERRWYDAAHIFAKGPYPWMRFEIDNGAPLCRACHRSIDSDHKAKLLFAVSYIGQERYDRLDLMSQGRGKCNVDLTILYLRQKVAEL